MDNLRPLAALGGLVTVVGSLLNFGSVITLADWAVSNLDLLLPLFTTMQGQIAPRVGWLDRSVLNSVVLALSVLLVLVKAARIGRRLFG